MYKGKIIIETGNNKNIKFAIVSMKVRRNINGFANMVFKCLNVNSLRGKGI